MDIISYILSRKYTDNSIVGLGAIKGANCTVKDIVHQDGINTVTFEWVGTDGTTKTRDMVVYDGTPIYVWESGNTYHYGDLAIYESQFYRCIVENNDVVFDNTKWNEIGSPDGNYDIVQSKALLPARFTAADRKLYFVIDECIFYLWDGTQWVGQTYLVQEETMPIASAKYLGRIYQYIGVTDTNFLHGCCYECVSDGANPPTYSWVSVGNSPIFTGTQAQWDSLTLAQQKIYEFVNIIGDEQNINLGIYLRKVNSMPNAEDCPSEIVMYVGTTTSTYTQGYIYRSTPTTVNNVTTYLWVRQDVQPSHPYVQSDWTQDNSNAHDYIKHKPTLGTASEKNYTSNVRPNNTDLVESQAVYSAINNALSSIYVPRGELSCAELTADLLIPANIGNVYTMSDSGTTSALFINGAGHPIAVNDNVGIIRAGEDTILFNLMGNAFDLHDYQTKELETPLIIDGTQETEVEDALSGLNEGLNNRVTYEYQGKMGAKNLVVYPYYRPKPTFNQSDIDFTANSDGSILVDGTASAYAGCDLALGTSYYKNIFTAGDYVISLNGISSNSNIRIQFRVYDSSTTPVTNLISVSTTKTVKKTSFTLTQEIVDKINNGTYNVNVRVFVGTAGDVVNNELCYPMICHAEDTDATWQPYAMTNYMLTKDMVKLNEIPIAKGTGNYSVIANTSASASGNNTASGNYSFVEGYGSTASGNDSHAEGVSTVASATASHAEGYYSEASGLYSHVQNYRNIAQGRSQTVIGKYNTAQGTSDSIADTDYALIVGNGIDDNHRSNALALQWDGTVVFQDGTTQKTSPYKLMGELGAKNLIPFPYNENNKVRNGVTWLANNDGSVNVSGTITGASYSYINCNAQNQTLDLKAGDYIASIISSNPNMHISVRLTNWSGVAYINLALAYNNTPVTFTVTQAMVDAIKNGTSIIYVILEVNDYTDEFSDVIYPMIRYASDTDPTWQPYAKTNYELTQDVVSLQDIPVKKGTGENSIIEGDLQNNISSGDCSHAEGKNTIAMLLASHAEGYNTQAKANCSHAEGNNTMATGGQSHSEGQNTTASASGAHSEGYNTTASAEASHAEGGNTTASGQYTHAEGSWSQAIGNNSHAEGQGSYSYGLTSHAQNNHTVARGAYQTTIGSYNIEQGTSTSKVDTDYALIIGNGVDGDHRSNALAVQWDGTVVMQDNSTIKSAKTVYEVMGKIGAKNLIVYPYTGDVNERNGITYNIQSDGSIVMDGTASAFSFCVFKRQENLLPHGTYRLSANGGVLPPSAFLSIGITNKRTYAFTTKASINSQNVDVPFTIDDSWDGYYIELRMSVNVGVTLDNVRLYPMIRLADDQDDTYQPYAMTNKQLTDKVNGMVEFTTQELQAMW